jgi:hypothetical protein
MTNDNKKSIRNRKQKLGSQKVEMDLRNKEGEGPIKKARQKRSIL